MYEHAIVVLYSGFAYRVVTGAFELNSSVVFSIAAKKKDITHTVCDILYVTYCMSHSVWGIQHYSVTRDLDLTNVRDMASGDKPEYTAWYTSRCAHRWTHNPTSPAPADPPYNH